uniref:Xylulose kinase-1 n=1 Tax=Tanacetum cinerariifolium TaxID=118510 RepID=A0A699IQB7_TANCI|nr:hypothetical protein [Tanacetum cinerariifolium]
MADLAFAPQHNMIAYLEKTESNAEFYEIVDFLTSSTIHHSLTVSPTIYAFNIEQFWNSVTSQTINDEKQIHGIMRKDLLFTDANGITLVEGEGSENPPESQPAPFPAQPINESQIPESSSPQNTQSPRKILEGTGTPYTRGPNFPDLSVDVEAVHKEGGEGSGSGLGRQETMGGVVAHIRSEGALIQSIDPDLSIGYTVGSGEDGMKHEIDMTDPVPQTPHD